MTRPFVENPIVLTDEERNAIQQWVDGRKRELALSDWDITVTTHSAEDSAFAASHIRDSADVTTIALGSEWRDLTPDELRETLVHELLHPHFHRQTRLAITLIENELGKTTEAVIEAAITNAEEIAIDRLATAVARWLPYVEIPDGLLVGHEDGTGT